MKLMVINTMYDPYGTGGAERSTQILAEGLAEKGYEVCVMSARPKEGWKLRNINGVRVYYIGIKNLYWPFGKKENPSLLKPLWHAIDTLNPWMKSSIKKVIKKESPDMVHTHNLVGFSVAAWEAAEEARVPVVHTARDYSLICPKNMYWRGSNCKDKCHKCTPYTYIKKKKSKKVDGFVGVSNFVRERHKKEGFFEKSKDFTVYNPIELEKIKSVNYKKGEELYFGYLGRISKKKGLESMLESLKIKGSKLYVGGIGNKNYEKKMKKKFGGKKAEFLGFVDPTEFFQKVDVLLVPSQWHEPFGRVVVEAYAHSVPVIATQRGGLPEIVKEGKTGFTYDPNKPKELNSHIQRFINNRGILKEMSIKARKEAENFKVKNHIKKYEDVYSEVA